MPRSRIHIGPSFSFFEKGMVIINLISHGLTKAREEVRIVGLYYKFTIQSCRIIILTKVGRFYFIVLPMHKICLRARVR